MARWPRRPTRSGATSSRRSGAGSSASSRQMGHGAGGSLDFDDGFADSGQVTAERGEVDALAGSLLETLQEIEDALIKFDDGTYGTCESCGNPIAEARLEAMPAARLLHHLRVQAALTNLRLGTP